MLSRSQAYILESLDEEGPKGLQRLAGSFEDEDAGEVLNTSQVLSLLRDLKTRGLVDLTQIKKLYRITERGEEALKQWWKSPNR